LLRALPLDLQAAIVVVQHVDPRFAEGLAVWLEEHARRTVRLATEGETPTPGAVLVAGTGDHLTLKSADRLGNTPEPADYAYRPSVDVFFRSICEQWQGTAVGVLLTGMGNDGAQGLKEMRERGFHTIAQDRETSAVYGMPKAAAALNAAVDILPIDLIAPRIVTLLAKGVQAFGAGA
jgi:chemotaxis response regulator CheB